MSSLLSKLKNNIEKIIIFFYVNCCQTHHCTNKRLKLTANLILGPNPTAFNKCEFSAFSTLSLSLGFTPLFTQPPLAGSDPISGKYISLDYLFFTHKCILISGKFPNAISSIAERDEQWRWLNTTHSYACNGGKRCKRKMKWMNAIYQQIWKVIFVGGCLYMNMYVCKQCGYVYDHWLILKRISWLVDWLCVGRLVLVQQMWVSSPAIFSPQDLVTELPDKKWIYYRQNHVRTYKYNIMYRHMYIREEYILWREISSQISLHTNLNLALNTKLIILY